MQNLVLEDSVEYEKDGVEVFLKCPKRYRWVWEDSVEYESDEFDEANQRMVVKTRHTYRIMGYVELCRVSFDSDEILSKDEVVRLINEKLRWGLYNEHELGEDDY